jgi:hypothetical protein
MTNRPAIFTTPMLFATARGEPVKLGDHHCALCFAACSDEHPTDTVVPDWSGYPGAADPTKPYACHGCYLATQTPLVNGKPDRAGQARLYSWVLWEGGMRRLTKSTEADGQGVSDLDRLREACLNPPAAPFSLTLSISGQKHLLYRTPVNLSREVVTAQLEIERVTYRPGDLRARLDLAKRVAAAAGKPSLLDDDPRRLYLALARYWEDWERLGDSWIRASEPGLSRLAAFLCPPMEVCRRDHPSDKEAAIAC